MFIPAPGGLGGLICNAMRGAISFQRVGAVSGWRQRAGQVLLVWWPTNARCARLVVAGGLVALPLLFFHIAQGDVVGAAT